MYPCLNVRTDKGPEVGWGLLSEIQEKLYTLVTELGGWGVFSLTFQRNATLASFMP